MGTAIEWTDAVWNPVTGCTKVSEGCRNCYAFALHDMRHKAYMEGKKLPQQYAKPFSEIQFFPDRLIQPLKWKKPRRVFVNSMADLFHASVPFDFIDKVFAAIALAPQHTFQILTKRPERMQEYMNMPDRDETIGQTAMLLYEQFGKGDCSLAAGLIHGPGKATNLPGVPERLEAWPLPNVWLGTSVENQKAADERIPLLLQTPAAVRFLSCEPLLGRVDLEWPESLYGPEKDLWCCNGYMCGCMGQPIEPPLIHGIDWVIAGGESGPKARPVHPDWLASLRDQCQRWNVPFFFKQWGEWLPAHELLCNTAGIKGKPWHNFDPDTSVCRVGKDRAGRLLDGREWNEFPNGGDQ
ncbi:phage Gp37/Gp68 family protein [Brevibacillus fluminis]|uniref:phage Gp37/Gp68 family protein n=1 Tax=Brevibacillus fluminis TaxID=511487 RepID=UPI003F890FCE